VLQTEKHKKSNLQCSDLMKLLEKWWVLVQIWK